MPILKVLAARGCFGEPVNNGVHASQLGRAARNASTCAGHERTPLRFMPVRSASSGSGRSSGGWARSVSTSAAARATAPMGLHARPPPWVGVMVLEISMCPRLSGESDQRSARCHRGNGRTDTENTVVSRGRPRSGGRGPTGAALVRVAPRSCQRRRPHRNRRVATCAARVSRAQRGSW